ncbi:MAG: glycosyltransferase family 2 protein [Chloroflexi bacterium]|nr:glycosyltransferase family 2 protein [Chloroflexota bacterium]
MLMAAVQLSLDCPVTPERNGRPEMAFVQAMAHRQEGLTPSSLQNGQFSFLALFDSPPELSVVLPVLNEEANIPTLYERLTTTMQEQDVDYELVFVDDGSQDKSLEQLHALAAKDRHVIVVELARNFGHQVAISAGLDHARGNAVIVMDADLQDPPEVLPQFIAKWQEGYDVVYAVREHRKENWLKRAAYAGFYRLLQRAANIEIPLDAGDFCIMDRKVVNLLRTMPERNRFIRGIRSWVGLRQIGLSYERQSRYAGRPKYTLGRLALLALDGLVSFSHTPLRLASLLGVSISALSFLLAGFYFVKKLTTGLSPPGFATLVVSIFFLAGIQLITIGVMGEYIGRVFDEVKQRPLYVVRQIVRGPF